jgi:biotin carboxylase
LNAIAHRGRPWLTAAQSRIRQPAIVLVDPVLNGKPFKDVCARSGYAVASVYTLATAELEDMAPDHRDGDTISIYSRDASVLGSLLASAVPDVRAIIPATEPATHIAAVLAEQRGVPGNSAAVGLARRDKVAMRELAARRGLRIPRFEVTERDGIAAAARRIGLPVIVKPPTGAASHGVRLITSEAELAGTCAGPDKDLFGNPVTRWLVEEYIRGPEYAVNTFSHGGQDAVIDIWEYRQLDQRDYDYPYQDFLQTEPDPRIASFALDVLRAFEISVGPAHIEIKLGPDGPVLIEVGARLPGAGIPVLWQRHSSIRPYHDTLAAHLGSKPRLLRGEPGFRASVGMTFIRNDGPPGVLRSLRGVGAARQLPGVDVVHSRAQVGDFVPTSDHLGAELVKAELSAPSHRELRTLADRVRELITAWVEPLPDAVIQPAA